MTADELWPHVCDAPNFAAMCRTLNALGVLNLHHSVKWPIARQLCERMGFEPSDASFRHQLLPAAHDPRRIERHRAATRQANAARHATPEGRDKDRQAAARWYAKNATKLAERRAEEYATNPEGRERERARAAAFRAKNPDYHLAYVKARYAEDALFATAWKLRTRFQTALRRFMAATGKASGKRAPTLELLGCHLEEFVAHIEAQFEPGMTWDNWAKDGWHLDHERPLASFDLSDPEQVREAMHFSNFRPLWAADNLSKGAKWNGARHTFRRVGP